MAVNYKHIVKIGSNKILNILNIKRRAIYNYRINIT